MISIPIMTYGWVRPYNYCSLQPPPEGVPGYSQTDQISPINIELGDQLCRDPSSIYLPHDPSLYYFYYKNGTLIFCDDLSWSWNHPDTRSQRFFEDSMQYAGPVLYKSCRHACFLDIISRQYYYFRLKHVVVIHHKTTTI